jgi:hypothetical protein
MSGVAVAIGVVGVAGAYFSAEAQKEGAEGASDAQSAAARAGIDEQRRQFDTLNNLLAPYRDVGPDAVEGLRDLAGLSGPRAGAAAIERIESGAGFQAKVRAGEDAILANASATGGLRGGNVQSALAQFRPAALSQEIETQYGRLAGLATLGQQSAAGTGAAALQTGTNVSNLLQQQGAAQAGNFLAQGQINANLAGAPAAALATYYGATRGGATTNPIQTQGQVI